MPACRNLLSWYIVTDIIGFHVCIILSTNVLGTERDIVGEIYDWNFYLIKEDNEEDSKDQLGYLT